VQTKLPGECHIPNRQAEEKRSQGEGPKKKRALAGKKESGSKLGADSFREKGDSPTERTEYGHVNSLTTLGGLKTLSKPKSTQNATLTHAGQV